MKRIKILLSAVVVLLVFSCKDEKKQDDLDKLPETFNVSFNLVVKKDDVFQLYFTQDGTLNFGDASSVKSVVKGSDLPQEILFKLPVDVLPTNIRLDFGDNKDQENVVVNSMKLKYFDKVFNANKNLVKNYFYMVDAQVKYDEKTSTVMIQKPANQVYDPIMWSNELLSVELTKLVK